MQTEIKEPLYKRLNKERTQGEWQQKEYNNSYLVNSQDLIQQTIIVSFHGNKEDRTPNIEYTALAVNNIHVLAEIVEGFINSLDTYIYSPEGHGCVPNGFTAPQYERAKEALNKIS